MRPYFVDWAITNTCNLNCIHCTGMADRELATDEALKLVDEIVSLEPGWLIVEGGEPLLRSDLFSILKRVRDYGLDVYVISNGNLLTEERLSQLRRLEVNLLLSVDGASKETYEGIKPGAKYELLLHWAERAMQEGVLDGFTVVVTQRNTHEIGDIVRLGERFGVREIALIGLKPFDNKRLYSKLAPSPQQMLEMINDLAREMRRSEVDIFVDEPFFWPVVDRLGLNVPPPQSRSCIEMDAKGCILGKYVYVRSDGDVRPCMFAQAKLTVGNALEESLSDLWDRMNSMPLLQNLKEGGRRRGPCSICQYLEECRGCVSRVYGCYGNPLFSDPLCPIGSLPPG